MTPQGNITFTLTEMRDLKATQLPMLKVRGILLRFHFHKMLMLVMPYSYAICLMPRKTLLPLR